MQRSRRATPHSSFCTLPTAPSRGSATLLNSFVPRPFPDYVYHDRPLPQGHGRDSGNPGDIGNFTLQVEPWHKQSQGRLPPTGYRVLFDSGSHALGTGCTFTSRHKPMPRQNSTLLPPSGDMYLELSVAYLYRSLVAYCCLFVSLFCDMFPTTSGRVETAFSTV